VRWGCSGELYIGRGWLAEAVMEGRWRWPVVLHQCFAYSKGRRWGTELTRGKGRRSGDALIHRLVRGEGGLAVAHDAMVAGKAAVWLGAGGGRPRQLSWTRSKAIGTWASSR
jgi:hypothetical protein